MYQVDCRHLLHFIVKELVLGLHLLQTSPEILILDLIGFLLNLERNLSGGECNTMKYQTSSRVVSIRE